MIHKSLDFHVPFKTTLFLQFGQHPLRVNYSASTPQHQLSRASSPAPTPLGQLLRQKHRKSSVSSCSSVSVPPCRLLRVRSFVATPLWQLVRGRSSVRNSEKYRFKLLLRVNSSMPHPPWQLPCQKHRKNNASSCSSVSTPPCRLLRASSAVSATPCRLLRVGPSVSAHPSDRVAPQIAPQVALQVALQVAPLRVNCS